MKWKRDFEDYCLKRTQQRNWPSPVLLDRFTESDSLCVVEAAPEAGWTSLQKSAPTDPAQWALAFFKSVDLIGGHGNPNLETVYWRGSSVLFSCSTLPRFNVSSPVPDDPNWLANVVQAAFRQDWSATLARSDLDAELRSRLVPLPPAETPRELVKTKIGSALPRGNIATAPSPTCEYQRTKPGSKSSVVLILTLAFSVLAAALAVLSWSSHITSKPGTAKPETPPVSPTTPSSAPPNAESEAVQIRYFKVEPKADQSGERVVLSWEVVHAKTVRIKGLTTLPLLVRFSDTNMSYPLPPKTRQIVLEAIGEGPNNSASAVWLVHLPISRYIEPRGGPFTLRPTTANFALIHIAPKSLTAFQPSLLATYRPRDPIITNFPATGAHALNLGVSPAVKILSATVAKPKCRHLRAQLQSIASRSAYEL